MSGDALRGLTLLVAEDEYLLADELCTELADRRAVIVGPAATVDQGLALLASGIAPDAAIFDVNLRGEPIFPLADLAAARGIPYVFTTGYDASAIPARFDRIPRCEKPVSVARVIDAVDRLLGTRF